MRINNAKVMNLRWLVYIHLSCCIFSVR